MKITNKWYYVDDNGDYYSTSSNGTNATPELVGFNIIEEIEPDYETFHERFHEAFRTESGLVLGKLGACWRVFAKDGFELIPYSHSLERKGSVIVSHLGARETEYDMSERSRHKIRMEQALSLLKVVERTMLDPKTHRDAQIILQNIMFDAKTSSEPLEALPSTGTIVSEYPKREKKHWWNL